MIEKDEARERWEKWERLCNECVPLRRQRDELAEEIKIRKKEIKEIEDLWHGCVMHENIDGFCQKCGLPDF